MRCRWGIRPFIAKRPHVVLLIAAILLTFFNILSMLMKQHGEDMKVKNVLPLITAERRQFLIRDRDWNKWSSRLLHRYKISRIEMDQVKRFYVEPNTACFVNVYGFHHSGTGILRSVIADSFPSLDPELISTLDDQRTFNLESEGSEAQYGLPLNNLAPQCQAQRPSTDNLPLPFSLRVFICSHLKQKFQNIFATDLNRIRLWHQWGVHWPNVEKARVFIQKSPSFKIWMHEIMLPKPTVHVISLRHPLFWGYDVFIHKHVGTHAPDCNPTNTNNHVLCWLITWLEIWSEMFRQWSESCNNNNNWAIVRYESMVQNEGKLDELVTFMNDSCAGPLAREPVVRKAIIWHRRRRLHLRLYGQMTDEFMWRNRRHPTHWDDCLNYTLCFAVLQMAENATRLLGYSVLNKAMPLLSGSFKMLGGGGGNCLVTNEYTKIADVFMKVVDQIKSTVDVQGIMDYFSYAV